jgi:Integral membrane protein S linking to the trans Golgi network
MSKYIGKGFKQNSAFPIADRFRKDADIKRVRNFSALQKLYYSTFTGIFFFFLKLRWTIFQFLFCFSLVQIFSWQTYSWVGKSSPNSWNLHSLVANIFLTVARRMKLILDPESDANIVRLSALTEAFLDTGMLVKNSLNYLQLLVLPDTF